MHKNKHVQAFSNSYSGPTILSSFSQTFPLYVGRDYNAYCDVTAQATMIEKDVFIHSQCII